VSVRNKHLAKMVRAFLIHTVRPGPCKILYSRFYGQESPVIDVNPNVDTDLFRQPVQTNSDHQETDPEIAHRLRNEQLQYTAEKVQESYEFRTSTTGKSFESDFARLTNDGILPEFELGFVLLPDDIFNTSKVVVWLAALNCGFTMICDLDDNRYTAESVLRLIVKFLQKYCDVLTKTLDLLSKVDKITVIVDSYLPCGQLVIMNHRLVRQIEKLLDTKIKQIA